MRADAAGMFWVEQPVIRSRKEKQLGPMPDIPDTGWVPPSTFPNLSAAKTLAIDTETKDVNLKKKGPGWARHDGHMVGFSIAVEDGTSWYFPLRHEVEPEYNIDPEQALRWAAHVLGDDRPKVGANIIYDVGWFREEGVVVGGKLYDVQYAEALLNSEAPHVELDALAQTHLGMRKETDVLYHWLAEWFGGAPTGAQRKWLYMSPPRLAGPYAEADAALPMQILRAQWPKLEQRGVMHLFDMECGLIPLLLEMRWKGAPVDLEEAQRFDDELTQQIHDLQARLKTFTGFDVNVNSSAEMARAFDELGLPYTNTAPTERFPQGQPSFTKEQLQGVKHGFAQTVLELKQRQKVQSTFVRGYILDSHVNGRVYGQFHPLKSDESGARSGRFASSDPNLQNIPIRTGIGKQVRRMFEAKGLWRKYDYSQIEYRLLVHHATGQGAEEARRLYNTNPDTDYHQFTIDLLKSITGIEMKRRPAKNINFGLIYGMGKEHLFRSIGEGAEQIYSAYHSAIPYAKATMEAASQEAQMNGHVSTVLGRKSDFTLYEPSEWGDLRPALPLELALKRYGRNVRLAKTHKALNRKLQGGAADIMKMAMWKLYHWGYFNEVGIPLLTVHDELDFDDEGAPQKAWDEMAYVMEHAVELSIPIRVDCSTGPNWGEAD
jgi:DNA polymerase I-like protein with 3'-5' exonuclease and polymerase domains